MKFKSFFVFILLLLILAGSNAVSVFLLIKQNGHIKLLQDNQNILLSDSLNKILLLNKSEFKRMLDPVFDSIESVKHIKRSKITNVTKIFNSYYDTTLVISSSKKQNDSIFNILIPDSCWGFRGKFNTHSGNLNISDRWANDEITKFTYFKRNHLFNLNFLPKWGRKRFFIDSYSKCKGKVKVEEFRIQKKR